MRYIKLISLLYLTSLFGCATNDPYPISESIAKINEKQILDPMAAENNEGIVNDLDGNYGKKVADSYQTSSVSPSEGKTGNLQVSGSSSGSNSNSNSNSGTSN